MTQKPSALNLFCLTAPILNAVSHEYCRKYEIRRCSERIYHYQLTGSHLNRLCENLKKLAADMGNCDVTFCDNGTVFHVASKTVLTEHYPKNLLQHENLGNKFYQDFVRTRLQGEESIWSTITKRKLKTFKTQLKIMKKKVSG